MHTPEPKEPPVQGTGNLKHILKTGLPPGVETEDITDPGAKARRETTLPEGPENGTLLDDFDDSENKDRV